MAEIRKKTTNPSAEGVDANKAGFSKGKTPRSPANGGAAEDPRHQQTDADRNVQASKAEKRTTKAAAPPPPTRDQRLAAIDEQQTPADERLRPGGPGPGPGPSPGPDPASPPGSSEEDRAMISDALKTNRILREVSRNMGDEWKSVFRHLLVAASFPPEAIEEEVAGLERQPPIIQGYRSLLVWKEIVGPDFSIAKLVEALRKNDMDDIADFAISILEERDKPEAKKTKPVGKPVQRRRSDVSAKSRTAFLDNRRMLLIAKKIGGDYEGIGKALALPDDELAEIKEVEGNSYQGAFKVLWAWRQTQPAGAETEATVEILRNAFRVAGKDHLADQLQTANK